MKKLINWLIKKLGGYTDEGYDYVIGEWEKALELNDKLYEIEENRLRIAESNVEYWYDKYTTEHENYLALLNCHNATAEAKMDALTMARGIKACCVATDDCSECRLAGENGKCNVNEIPCYWEVE